MDLGPARLNGRVSRWRAGPSGPAFFLAVSLPLVRANRREEAEKSGQLTRFTDALHFIHSLK